MKDRTVDWFKRRMIAVLTKKKMVYWLTLAVLVMGKDGIRSHAEQRNYDRAVRGLLRRGTAVRVRNGVHSYFRIPRLGQKGRVS